MSRYAFCLAISMVLLASGLANAQCCVPTVTYFQPQTVHYAVAPTQTVFYAPATPATTVFYAPATVVYRVPAPTTVFYAPTPVPVVASYGRPLVGAGITRVASYTPTVTYVQPTTVLYRGW